MSDIVGGLRQLFQDLVAPDLKAIQGKQGAQYNASNAQHNAIMAALEAFRAGDALRNGVAAGIPSA